MLYDYYKEIKEILGDNLNTCNLWEAVLEDVYKINFSNLKLVSSDIENRKLFFEDYITKYKYTACVEKSPNSTDFEFRINPEISSVFLSNVPNDRKPFCSMVLKNNKINLLRTEDNKFIMEELYISAYGENNFNIKYFDSDSLDLVIEKCAFSKDKNLTEIFADTVNDHRMVPNIQLDINLTERLRPIIYAVAYNKPRLNIGIGACYDYYDFRDMLNSVDIDQYLNKPVAKRLLMEMANYRDRKF